MKLLLLLLVLQPEPAELLHRMREARPPAFRGELRVERIGKRVESVSVLSGPMIVRTGEALSARLSGARNVRLVLTRGRMVTIRGRSRTAHVTDLSRADRFHPLDLWRDGAAEGFRVALDGDEEGLPPAVSGAGGRSLEPARMERDAARTLAAAGEAGAVPWILTLVPRNRQLSRRVRRIRLELDRRTGRLSSVVADGPYARVRYSLSDVRPIAQAPYSEFEIDLSRYNVEER